MKIKLLQCCRKSCGHVFTPEEHEWIPSDIGKRAVCPLCGREDYYTLDEQGRAITARQHEQYRDGIEAELITRNPRSSSKKRNAIMAAVQRAVESRSF